MLVREGLPRTTSKRVNHLLKGIFTLIQLNREELKVVFGSGPQIVSSRCFVEVLDPSLGSGFGST